MGNRIAAAIGSKMKSLQPSQFRMIEQLDVLGVVSGVEAVLDDFSGKVSFKVALEGFHAGIVEPIDAVAGHVPGAVNHPFTSNLDADGRFLPAAELKQRWRERLGGGDAGSLIAMCGSGVTACHNLLAMEYAGLHGSRLYAPSWSGWISDPSRPVAKGDSE